MHSRKFLLWICALLFMGFLTSCHLETPCTEFQEWDIELQECVDISYSDDACGYPAVNCNELKHFSSGICVNGICHATQCEQDYHISSDRLSCEKDTVHECGNLISSKEADLDEDSDITEDTDKENSKDSKDTDKADSKADSKDSKDTDKADSNEDTSKVGTVDCLAAEGVAEAHCSKGKCILDACSQGFSFYTLNDTKMCLKDQSDTCGGDKFDCKQSTMLESECINGQCVVKKCIEGHHKAKHNSHETCAEDTIHECGESLEECMKPNSGIAEAACEKGLCIITSCLETHSAEKTDDKITNCIENTKHACGIQRIDCEDSTQGIKEAECHNSECIISSCLETHSYNSGSKKCELDTPEQCGETRKNCIDPDANIKSATCNNHECQITECVDGYEYNSSYNACKLIYYSETEDNLGKEMFPEFPAQSDPVEIKDPFVSRTCKTVDISNTSLTGNGEIDTGITYETPSYNSRYNTIKVIQITRDEEVCLKLTGTRKGILVINSTSKKDVYLIFNNISILTESEDRLKPYGHIILTNNYSYGNTFHIKLEGNNLIDGPKFKPKKSKNSVEDPRGNDEYLGRKKVFYGMSNVKIYGPGSLTVNSRFKTAIYVDDILTINGGTINVTVDRKSTNYLDDGIYEFEKGFGIKAINGFEMNGGTVNINAEDTVHKNNTEEVTGYECRGIQVKGCNDTEYCRKKGQITINGGKLTIKSHAKGLNAGWKPEDAEEDENATHTNATYAPTPDIFIKGGVITINTTAKPRTEDTMQNFDESVKLSPEGIEGKRKVSISGGEVYVHATDDAINAKTVVISGGHIYAQSMYADGIDANADPEFEDSLASIYISGGVFITMGADGTQGGIDGNMSTNVTYSGGYTVALGAANNAPEADGTSKSFISVQLPDNITLAGNQFILTEKDFQYVLMGFNVPEDYTGGNNLLILADTNIAKTKTYALYQAPLLENKDSLVWFYNALLMVYSKANLENATPLCYIEPNKLDSKCEPVQ